LLRRCRRSDGLGYRRVGARKTVRTAPSSRWYSLCPSKGQMYSPSPEIGLCNTKRLLQSRLMRTVARAQDGFDFGSVQGARIESHGSAVRRRTINSKKKSWANSFLPSQNGQKSFCSWRHLSPFAPCQTHAGDRSTVGALGRPFTKGPAGSQKLPVVEVPIQTLLLSNLLRKKPRYSRAAEMAISGLVLLLVFVVVSPPTSWASVCSSQGLQAKR